MERINKDTEEQVDSGFIGIPELIADSEASELISATSTSHIYKIISGSIRRVLKTIAPPNRDSLLYTDMLRKEWEILSGLSHPGIVIPIQILKLDDGSTALILEWIDGTPLDKFLSMPQDTSVRRSLALQLLDIVAYLHAKGIVHRDIKPTNLMVTHNGCRLKLIDFGLSDMSAYTHQKFPAGTTGYMSSHQMQSYSPLFSDDMFAVGRVLENILADKGSKRIARRCAEDEYLNASDVATALKKVWARPTKIKNILRTAFITLTAGMVVAGVSIYIFTNLLSKQHKALTADIQNQKEIVKKTRLRADSIHRADSLSLLKLQNEQRAALVKKKQQEALFNNIRKKGEEGIDKIWRDADKADNDYEFQFESNNYINQYVSDHSGTLSEIETTTLERIMKDRWKKHSDIWRKKHQND